MNINSRKRKHEPVAVEETAEVKTEGTNAKGILSCLLLCILTGAYNRPEFNLHVKRPYEPYKKITKENQHQGLK